MDFKVIQWDVWNCALEGAASCWMGHVSERIWRCVSYQEVMVVAHCCSQTSPSLSPQNRRHTATGWTCSSQWDGSEVPRIFSDMMLLLLVVI